MRAATIPTAPASEWLDRLAAVVGPAHAVREPAGMAPWLVEPRDIFHGNAALVVRPGSTEDVSRLLAIANEGRVPIVAQSGNTGLVGGQSPSVAGNEVVLSLDRLDKLRDVDATDNTITVEAGMTLKSVQDAAASAGRLFPLSLASEGSCRIGGNLATNAGGIGVIAYGSARDLCLGLEVVLADGRVWEGLRRLRKDNTGYDLKDLFIGSEGTLGVITAAVLKLFPTPRARATAWIGVTGPQAGLDLLDLARQRGPGQVTAIELVPRIGLEFTMRHAGTRDPLTPPSTGTCFSRFRAWRTKPSLPKGSRRCLPKVSSAVVSAMRWWRSPARRPPTCGASGSRCPKCSATKAARSSTTCRCRCRASPPSSPRRAR
jgi:FAD/FMN-containing dehydrogenase